MARHRPVSYRLEMMKAAASPFEDADLLAKKYGFVEGFDLRAKLDEAVGMFETVRAAEPPTAKQRRARLDLLDKEVRALLRGQVSRREALAKLLIAGGAAGLPFADDAVERALARGRLADVFTKTYLNALLDNIGTACVPLRRKRPPNSGDAARRFLVQDLATIWTDGTGRAAAATWDEAAGRYSDTIVFMCEVFRRVGDGISPEAVRHLLRRGHARRRTRSRK